QLARMTHRLLPDDGEVAGLLALMLLVDARRPARTDAEGELVPLAAQDRSLWHRERIAEGTALLDGSIGKATPGEYQLQAAIAANLAEQRHLAKQAARLKSVPGEVAARGDL